MSIQYPYTLQKLSVAPSTQDANGDFSSSVSGWTTICACRNEDGRQQKFSKDDGSYLTASHLIYCPGGTFALNAGEKVRVIEQDGTVRLQGQVLYSSKDRFHTRIWV